MGIRVVTVVIVAVVLAGVLASVTLDSQAALSSRVSSARPSDDFEREPATDGLGRAPGGPQWREVRGAWAISLGRARTLQSTALLSPALTTVDRSDPDGVVAVTLAQVAEGAGLVFRYQDPANFWAVVMRPDAGQWLVLALVEGQIVFRRDVAGLFGSASVVAPGTEVEVRLDGPWIDVFFNGVKAMALYGEDLQEAADAGLIATGGHATDARFDDFYSLASE